MMTETRGAAAAVRFCMEKEIESTIRQMRIDGATVEDCEAELDLPADFVRAHADGLRTAWPEPMKDTGWELKQQKRSLTDAFNEAL